MPPEEFGRLLRDSPNPAVDHGEVREAYRYAKVGGIFFVSFLSPDDLKPVREICDALTA